MGGAGCLHPPVTNKVWCSRIESWFPQWKSVFPLRRSRRGNSKISAQELKEVGRDELTGVNLGLDVSGVRRFLLLKIISTAGGIFSCQVFLNFAKTKVCDMISSER